MTEALTSVTGRTITRPITSVAGSRIDDVYGEDGEDGDEDADDDDDDETTMLAIKAMRKFLSQLFRKPRVESRPRRKSTERRTRPQHASLCGS